jgi:hypothetical protein
VAAIGVEVLAVRRLGIDDPLPHVLEHGIARSSGLREWIRRLAARGQRVRNPAGLYVTNITKGPRVHPGGAR